MAARDQPLPRWQVTSLSDMRLLQQEFCGALCTILVIDAVESVAANASTEPFVGTWVYDCWQWHLSMEPRIENSHLWHGAQQLLNCFHPFLRTVHASKMLRAIAEENDLSKTTL